MADARPGRYMRIAGYMFTYDAFKRMTPEKRAAMRTEAYGRLSEALEGNGTAHALDRSDYTSLDDVNAAFAFWESKLSSY